MTATEHIFLSGQANKSKKKPKSLRMTKEMRTNYTKTQWTETAAGTNTVKLL